MDNCAFLFSGQGAQKPGMGADLYAGSAAARALYDRANGLLGFDLAKVCFEGTEQELSRTDICQPAIFVTSLAALEAYKEAGGDAQARCRYAAGLSLGEYTALTFADALGFEEGLKLVRLRGQYMQEACEAAPSGMLSLLGADRAQAQALCDAVAEQGHLNIANVNAPGQIVISGDMAGIDAAEKIAKEHGARRAMKLAVAGAFHSKLMQSAEEKLSVALRSIPICEPRIPVVSNVTGQPVTDPEAIRANLSRQVVSSVLWADSVACMVAAGIRTYYEFGPGRVLTGLLRKIEDGLTGINIQSMESVQSISTGATQ